MKPVRLFTRSLPLFIVLVALILPLVQPILTGPGTHAPSVLAQDDQSGSDADVGTSQDEAESLAVNEDTSSQIPDRDADGIADDQDECPDDATNTCNLSPDRDADGIADDQDECPDDAANTCTLPSDRDADGIPDNQDICPDDPSNVCGQDVDDESAATEPPVITETPDQLVNAAAAQVSIGDRVWEDSNRNGLQDPGELGLANIIYTLYPVVGDSMIATGTTDSNGNYWIQNLTPGSDYLLVFGTLSNYTWTIQNAAGGNGSDSRVDSSGNVVFTAPAAGNNQGGPGIVDDPTLDAGLQPPVRVSVGDWVWYDQNQNGRQEFDELGAANIGVTLTMHTMR